MKCVYINYSVPIVVNILHGLIPKDTSRPEELRGDPAARCW